jgi:hypothetical protein
MFGLSSDLGMNDHAVEAPLKPLLLGRKRIGLNIKMCTCVAADIVRLHHRVRRH